MEQAELLGMIKGRNEEIAGEQEARRVFVEQTTKLRETAEHALLAGRLLLDHFKVEPKLLEDSQMYKRFMSLGDALQAPRGAISLAGETSIRAFVATSPVIPLGELEGVDLEGCTHGFGRVNLFSDVKVTNQTTFKWGLLPSTTVTLEPKQPDFAVAVELLTGNEAGTDRRSVDQFAASPLLPSILQRQYTTLPPELLERMQGDADRVLAMIGTLTRAAQTPQESAAA